LGHNLLHACERGPSESIPEKGSAITALTEVCFIDTAPIVGIFAVGLMRAAFD
jgi:hypothetical protein